MKLLDFGVGGGRIVVAKRLIYSQFSTNKILPQKEVSYEREKAKKGRHCTDRNHCFMHHRNNASPSDDKKDDSNPKQTEQQNTEVTEQASETTEPKTEEKDEPAEIDGVDIIFSDTVRNDKTGNWRLAKVTGDKSAEEYAADYYKQYFKADNEVHAVVNFTLNTTACITCVGDTLNVRIYEHIKDEEQYAENLFTGTKYAEYNVDKNTGDVEKVE